MAGAAASKAPALPQNGDAAALAPNSPSLEHEHGEEGEEELRRPKRLTKKILFVLCAINLVDCINTTILTPYVDAMVSHILEKPRGDPGVAVWVSWLVGSYSVCEVVFSGFWGMLSDRIGRRPVLLLGLLGSSLAIVAFGLSSSLEVAFAARLVDGFFCGNVATTRTYLGELVDSSNEAKSFGYLALTFSVGIFIGPSLGGILSEPAQWAPGLFKGTLFETYPYFLPNLIYALFAVFAFLVGAASLHETLPKRRRAEAREVLLRTPAAAAAAATGGVPAASAAAGAAARSPLLVPLIASLSLLSGYTAARLQSFVLVLSLPAAYHGMDFGPKVLGYFQVGASCIIFLTQMVIYQPLMNRLGPHRCSIVGIWWTVVLTIPFPLYCLMYDADRFGFWRYLPPGLFQAISQVGFSTSFPTAFVLINRECSPHNRGSVNGWANACQALCRGLFPLLAGGLITLGVTAESMSPVRVPGGRYLVFYVNMLAAAVCIIILRRLTPAPVPEAPPAETRCESAT
eukprot:TRINITY_DN10350_c3_g1_i1.p1 TRINITY_DN10350_c3_g1~~TRINITY_DN10350_c3_g1_i1.p1  ORF type:complete len:515 (+),score=84.94 TRINITY_DN10350_c3_g1_i1:56-1600(+)